MDGGAWVGCSPWGHWESDTTEQLKWTQLKASFSLLAMLLLLLSCFSHVWLCATPKTTACQAPPSLGFSRQEHWSGLPFPSPMHERERERESEVVQSCATLSIPMDCSLPGSSVHAIFQARVLEWGAIAFSEVYYQYSKFMWPGYDDQYEIISDSCFSKQHILNQANSLTFHFYP